MNARLLISCLSFLSESKAAESKPVEERPRLQSPAVTEASGLAISAVNPDFMWIINDSGSAPEIHLAGTDGTDRGKVRVTGIRNIDWEDLASFTLDGQNYLLVADTGDNNSSRKSCTFHICPEPAIPAKGAKLAGSVIPAWRIEFVYDGGPRDCEAVAVDVNGGKIILISKRTQPPEIYQLPLRPPERSGVLTAQNIGQVEVKSPLDGLIPFHNQPTGLAIAADGLHAAIITYYGVFLFPRKLDEIWSDAFARQPDAVLPHLLGQAESVAFSKDSQTIYAISEGRSSPIARLPLRLKK